MKLPFLAATIALGIILGAGSLHAQSASERLKEAASDAGDALRRAADVVVQEGRQAWGKTEAYFTDDPATYRGGATQKLDKLTAEVNQLRERSVRITGRDYLKTQVLALDQQLQFARQQLTALPDNDIRQGHQGPRRHLDNVLTRVEGHVDITRGELDEIERAP